ncbi:MAG: TVP38/TMEM64 family protein [Deltaproteobacteria bacterium]|nr:TVP38/TMEM64 family protein [Deltaproteobacteria bacterium]
MESPTPSRRWPRFVVGVLLLAVVVLVLTSDLSSDLSGPVLRDRLLSWGPWGPIAFVVAFALLQPFGLSAHVFIIAASLVWSPLPGAALSWLGATAAGCVAFGFARWMGRGWVQSRLPSRLVRWDQRLADHGFRTVLVLRLLFFTLGPMQLMLGVSKVRFGAFVLGTMLGVLPVIVLRATSAPGS